MIKIDENQDKDVTYENEPDSQRQLFPNIPLTVDVSPLQDAIDDLDDRMDDVESDIDSIMTTIQSFDGQPGVAETVSDMTDTNKIYVYVGSETGYTSGDWYYYDGTAWVSGGAYAANPVQIDDTLTQSDEAADAKVTGDEITQLKSAIDSVFSEQTIAHEAATTSAQSYYYYLTGIIPKNTRCLFTNTSSVQYTLNVGDGVTEVGFGAVPAGVSVSFITTLDIDRIRCYCPANSTWKFTLVYGGIVDNTVSYFAQTETDSRKKTARDNIGAASAADMSTYVNKSDYSTFANNYITGTTVGNAVSLSSSTSSWVYSSVPMLVKKGCTVHCKTRGSGMCAIATSNTNDFSSAVCRVPASDNTQIVEYSYTANDADIYAWVSGRVNETTAWVDYSTLYNIGQQISGLSYTVKPNGSGDFTTFTGMLDALKNNAEKKTVFVYPGTYDIFEELGGAEYVASITNPTSLNWNDVNPLVPDNTTIIGVGNVILSYEPEDSEMPSSDHAFLFAALNIPDVSCEVENVTINAKNCRYAVHIENGQSEANRRVTFKNVRVNMGNGGKRNAQAVGTGIGNNAKWRFDDCDFHNATNGGCFTSHTNVPLAGDSASVEFNNCTFTVDGQTSTGSVNIVQLISAYNPTPANVKNFARFTSCYFSGKCALVNGYDDRDVEKKQLFDLTMINCIANTLFVSDTFASSEPTHVYT